MGSFGTRLIAATSVASILMIATTAFAGCGENTVEMRGQNGAMQFHVEIADEEAERSLGLMNRASMPTSAGMLFVYQNPKRPFFWMKNTLIPLDMIFANAAGQITRVHSNAKPLDVTPIDGGDGVVFVLEINGGLAERLKIREGDLLRADVIDQTAALWPCDGD